MTSRYRKEWKPDHWDSKPSLQWMLLFACFILFVPPGLLRLALSVQASQDGYSHSSQHKVSDAQGSRGPINPLWMEYLYYAGSLTLLLLGVPAIRRMRRKTKLAIIKEERERLARELHDTVIRGCTGVAVLLEAIASTHDGKQKMQGELLDCAREQARQTVESARNAVWDLRRSNTDSDLVPALKELGEQISRESGSAVDVRHNIASLHLPASSIEEITMTVREAICNAVRHSGSEKILVDLRSERKSLRVCVQDYGRGISETTKADDSRHYGILGMRERMERIGGGLHVDCMPGAGTTVQLVLRWGSMRRLPARI